MDNINESNSKFSYEELLEQNTRLKNQVQEIQRISKKVEDKYQRIIESSPLGMLLYTLTEEDRLIFNGYNKSAERILGVELESLIGKTIEEAFPPLAQTEIPFEYKKTAKTSEEFFTNQVDYDFDKIKGAYEVRAYQVSKNNIAVNFSDISERLKREVEIEESQQKFKSLFDNIDEGVALHKMIFDEDNNPIDFVWLNVNPTYEKLTRLKKKDLIGKKSKDVIPNIEQKWYDLYAEVVRTGIPKTLTDYSEYLDKCWEVKAFRPQEGYFAVAMTDVTEKVIGEKKLKESEEQYKILFENIIDEVHYWKVIKDKKGKIITWVLVDANKSALKAWNKTKEQVIGKTANEIFNSDAQKLFMPIVKKIFKTGKSFSWETYFPATKQYLSMDSIPLGDFFISTGRDITIRKKEEQELIKAKEIAEFNERELNKVQEITRIGSWYLDVATNEVVWTKELYKMYGFDESQPIPPYTEHMKLFTAESWELLSESLEQTRKSGIPYELELRTIKKDGSNGWMWVRGETIQKNGVTVKLWGAAQDITERKLAEKSLRSSQEMLLSSQSLANICSYSTNLNPTEINKSYWECSPEFYKIFGIDETYPHTIEGWIGFLHPEYRKDVAAYHESVVLEKKSFNREYKIIRINDGVERWVHGTGELVYDEKGNPIRMHGAIQDITERKQAELALKESEERYRNLVEAASDAIYLTEEDGTIIDTNQSALDISGKNREEIVGHNIDTVDVNFPAKEFVKFWKKYPINKQLIFETTHRHKNGDLIPVEISSKKCKLNDRIYLYGIARDITERKKTERELINAKEKAEVSEENLKTTLQTAMDGYWVVDMNGRFLNVNDAYCKMSGYNREDFLSMQISDIEAIQSPEEINENIQKIKQLGQLRFETKHVRKDGSIYDTEIGIQYQERYNGQFVCFIKDITEQKKHEAAIVLAKEVAEQNELKIKLNEQRLNALVELNQMTDKSDDYIYDFTLNKAIELTQSKIGFLGFVNADESEVDIYKWSDSAMKECDVRNMNMNFIVDETGVWGEVVRQRKPLVLNDYSQPIPNKNGIPVGHVNIKNYLSIPTFQQNKIVAIISVSNKEDDYVQSDINQLTLLLDGMRRFLVQRKEKEALINARQKAEESQMQLELITDNFVNGMIYQVAMLDENRRQFNYISTNVKKLYGCTVKEAKEDANLIYGKLHPDDVMGLIEKEKEALKNMSVFETESRVITPNGNIRWAYYISKPRIINGIVCWDGIEVDITERKQMELELINAKEKAEESERLKSAFLANMSHEIRTPMNGILGFTSLLQKANLSIENQKNYIDIIQKSGGRLLNTVNDIIEISKIESGEIKITKSEVDIIGHLETHVAFFRPEANKKNLDLVVQNNIDGNHLIITTDKNKLSSVLSNLIKNAIKYTNEGTIKVGLKIENNQVLFSCQDTGIGISKSRQEAIFNRFEQADIDDKQAHQGSGLGLAIVKTYVEMLDGKIWVESEEGQGSTFYVSLPYKHEKKKEQIIPQEAKSSDSGIKNINVLVVEDEEDSSMHLSILIKDKVKSIKTAENGIEAIDTCKNDSGIDLILMDIKMPKMNGIEATKKIRKFNKDVVIIAQTAYALEGDEGKALDAGCDDYISKPIDENILFELINKYF